MSAQYAKDMKIKMKNSHVMDPIFADKIKQVFDKWKMKR